MTDPIPHIGNDAPRSPESARTTIDGPVTMPTDQSGWWETERAAMIRARIASLTDPGDHIIDVGCGRGTMFTDDRLADRVAIRVDSHVWDEWFSAPGIYVCANADALPFRSTSFDLVGSFDVLEHLTDDRAALVEQRRISRPNATVVSAIPADPRLWSSHDEAVGHQRRYTRSTFIALANSVALRPTRCSYFFAYLWLPARMMRSSSARRNEGAKSAEGKASAIVRCAVHLLSTAERLIMKRWSLPLGTSLWVEMTAPNSINDIGPKESPQ